MKTLEVHEVAALTYTVDKHDFDFGHIVITKQEDIIALFGRKEIKKSDFPVGLLTLSAYSEEFKKTFPEWLAAAPSSVIALSLDKGVLGIIPQANYRKATREERFLYAMMREPMELGEHS